MADKAENLFHWLRRWWVPLVVLLLGLTASAVVTELLLRASEAEARERFIASLQRRVDSINDRINTYVAMLRAGAGFFAASDYVTHEEFNAFVQQLHLDAEYPGIQGVGFSRRVSAEQLPELVRRQRAAGREDFTVWPEDPRDEYHAILYLEPMDARNAAAIGYDMFTHPVRRAAMEQARDRGQPAASGRVTLVQEITENKQPGFLIYLPIYQGGAIPDTEEERRQKLVGFIYSPFRTVDLFRGIFGRQTAPRAAFDIYDGTEISPDTLLFSTGARPAAGGFSATRELDVAGRTWTIAFSSVNEGAVNGRRWGAVILFCGGALITLLLAGLSWQQTRAHHETERSEAEHREHARTMGLINRTGPVLAAELNLQKLVQAVTDAATELTGAQFGAFFYNTSDEQGEHYTLFTISGVPREHFDKFPMPRNTAVFGPTFSGAEIVRSDDITQDPRYGKSAPYHGMPKGHLPVKSYLAVPVVSRTGQVHGGLFFGHAEAARFTQQHERIVAGIASQAAIGIDNARLVEQMRESEERLRDLNATLEQRVADRTAELRESGHKLRLLATRLSAAENQERRRIAYLLHDHFQQILVAAKISLEPLRRQGHSTEAVSRVNELIGEAIAASRTLAIELFPPALYDRGLAVGLEWLARHVQQQHKLHVDLHADPAANPENRDVQGFLFHSVRELLLNVVKHAGTERAIVKLEKMEQGTRLTVEDQGKGCDPRALKKPTSRNGGFGLFSIQQRVQLLGGTFDVATEPGGGCRITLTVPTQDGDNGEDPPIPEDVGRL